MKHLHASNPSTTSRSAAFRAMAFAALRADSSLSVRLARYNAAMVKARALDASHCSSSAIGTAWAMVDTAPGVLKVGSRIITKESGRTGHVVKVYRDGSAAIHWDDREPQPEGLAHERMPASLLMVLGVTHG